MENSLFITVRKNNSTVILDLQGEASGSWAQRLNDKLEELHGMGESHIILNFQEVMWIDTVGVWAISAGIKAGQRIKILHPNTNCIEVLQQDPVTAQVEIFSREEDALRSFPNAPSSQAERRRFKRIGTNFPIEIEYRNHRVQGVLLNISEGGALLGYLDPLAPAIEDGLSGSHRLTENLSISWKVPFVGIIELSGRPVSFRQNSVMHTVGIQILHNERSLHLLQKMVDSPETSFPPQG